MMEVAVNSHLSENFDQVKKADKQRIYWIDIFKAIAIICVIAGHLSMPEAVHNFIYSFHLYAFC